MWGLKCVDDVSSGGSLSSYLMGDNFELRRDLFRCAGRAEAYGGARQTEFASRLQQPMGELRNGPRWDAAPRRIETVEDE